MDLSSSEDETEGLDKEGKKAYQHRKQACEHIMKIFDKISADPTQELPAPESRSQKMQKQLKHDKLMTLLSTFESALSLQTSALQTKISS